MASAWVVPAAKTVAMLGEVASFNFVQPSAGKLSMCSISTNFAICFLLLVLVVYHGSGHLELLFICCANKIFTKIRFLTFSVSESRPLVSESKRKFQPISGLSDKSGLRLQLMKKLSLSKPASLSSIMYKAEFAPRKPEQQNPLSLSS